MIKLNLDVALEYTVNAPSADFIFYIHAANTSHQRVVSEYLTLEPPSAIWEIQTHANAGQRCLRLSAQPGALSVRYQAAVEIDHHMQSPRDIAEVPIHRIPQEVLPYLYPSRYCQSDRVAAFANNEFGSIPQGYARAQAISDWVYKHVKFLSNSSNATTSALDTLVERVGVCRDFAHLMIALCRALNLPARFATGTDYGADPDMGPPDFHAYVEVYLGDRWYMFDPSGMAIPMGMLRLATGRDAADVAFATIFGYVSSAQPRIEVTVEQDASKHWVLPAHTTLALSTAALGD